MTLDADAATANHELVRLLACTPDPRARGSAVQAVAATVCPIHEAVVSTHYRGESVVTVPMLRCWHHELDTGLGLLENEVPEVWVDGAAGYVVMSASATEEVAGRMCAAKRTSPGERSVSYAEMGIAARLWFMSIKDGGVDG